MRGVRIASIAMGVFSLAACGSLSEQTPASQTSTDVMAGRWILSAPNAPTCGINFSGDPGVQQGALVPEGGCPERFFLSRSWALDRNTLTIRDDGNQVLAQLIFANGAFSGTSTGGTPVTLTREANP